MQIPCGKREDSSTSFNCSQLDQHNPGALRCTKAMLLALDATADDAQAADADDPGDRATPGALADQADVPDPTDLSVTAGTRQRSWQSWSSEGRPVSLRRASAQSA